MQKVKSLTWIILFSVMLMSHLYKEFSCESIVHKIDNGLEQIFDEKQVQDMTTEDSEQEILTRLQQSHGPFPKVFIPDQEPISVKSENVGADGPESKQDSMGALLQMSKQDYLRDAPSERKRRHSAGQQPADSECQRHAMYVNFATLGLDKSIIYPPGYNAYYCAGICPLQLANFNSTKHAQIQGLMNITNPNIPKPCCVPTKLSSLQVIYFANSNVNDEHWKEMIVDACGCL